MSNSTKVDDAYPNFLNRYQRYTKSKTIKGKEFEFKVWPHEEVCHWIEDQTYLKGTIHESFSGWKQAHTDNHFDLSGPHFWSTAWDGNKMVGIYYCCEANLDEVFGAEKVGIYDGFLLILPEYRGFGLGRLLDEFKNYWTYQDLKWHHNWTFALPSLLEFNLKLGYTDYDEEAYERGEYTTLWRTSNNPEQLNSF